MPATSAYFRRSPWGKWGGLLASCIIRGRFSHPCPLSRSLGNKFYLTNYDGKKLKDNYAKLCAQRLSEFAFYCKPSTREHKTEFTRGNMTVSNAHHDKFSRLTITGEPDRQGFLLELCSVLSGLGMHAKSGSVQSCADCGTDVNVPEFAATSGRVFEIFLTNKENKQLDSEDANALLFVLGMLLDPASHGPTVVPNLI